MNWEDDLCLLDAAMGTPSHDGLFEAEDCFFSLDDNAEVILSPLSSTSTISEGEADGYSSSSSSSSSPQPAIPATTTATTTTTTRKQQQQPLSKEEKQELRRERNRALASESRKRKSDEMSRLREENAALRQRLAELEDRQLPLSTSAPSKSSSLGAAAAVCSLLSFVALAGGEDETGGNRLQTASVLITTLDACGEALDAPCFVHLVLYCLVSLLAGAALLHYSSSSSVLPIRRRPIRPSFV